MYKGILVAAAVLLPAASFAATYNYVDTSGSVRTVSADSATAAIAVAPDRAAHSGVAIDNGVVAGSVAGASTSAGTGTPGVPSTGLAANGNYDYVNVSGMVKTVSAGSPQEALFAAGDIAMHSGVAADTGTLQDGTTVPGTR
jgi:hypothetical protein